MGNCCKTFAREENREENPMISSPMGSEGNRSGRTSRYSDAQAITTPLPTHARNIENKREQAQDDFRGYYPGFVDSEYELIAAGWPSWMVKDAGEAFKGWVPRKEQSFLKLAIIGEGAYSIVYRALDLEQGKIVALKKIKFKNLKPKTIRFMAREIAILRRLDHPNIIKLEGLVAAEDSCHFYLVLEHMEYDLVGLASLRGLKFREPQVKRFMKQLFSGLDYCHRQGILHRDLKGANLLLDTNGNLKIADFGLANFYDPQQGCPLTNQVVTLWYRPPELLLGATCYGAAVDLWSAGCILAELYVGRPIFRGRTEVDQLHRIFKLCGSPPEDYLSLLQLPPSNIFNRQKPFRRCVAEIFKDLPAPALALIETLLSLDPSARQSATDALNSEYFLTEPLPCKAKEVPE
ncbi:putative serine/threonine-protein kinase [Heracleum sosnowskyi]|uniref:Serine/threonine-protein kinase n=1 Tax=Heracleum sosnowskyi TaxID=360622 RepID=A0AAD8J4H3_9APIA|nr:putative serine/threonine-protein kinase [Heracleum sosnowskyi]